MHRSYLATGLIVLSMLFFSVTYAFYKACTPFIPNTQILFLQSLCSLILLLPIVFCSQKGFLKTDKFWPISLRTIFGLSGTLCITAALKTTALAEVVLLNNSAPLFVPLILFLLHKTKLSPSLAFSILLGFAGVYLVLHPASGTLNSGMLLAALSGLFSALLLVVTKQFAHEPFLRILFYYYLLWCGLLSPFALLDWHPMSPLVTGLLLASALTSIAAQLTFTASMRFAPSQEIAPFIYTSVIFSGIIGWMIWDEKIGWLSLAGMVIVCLGGLLTMRAARRSV